MSLLARLSTLLLVVPAAPLAAQAAPPGFETPDHDVRIGVRPGLLRYDKEEFSVAPGSKVKLTLTNPDAMQHNLVICRPGPDVTSRVAMAALQLGAEASDKHFVPDTPDVLFHTKALFLDQTDTIWFVAPEAAGDYPYVCTFPGHSFTMLGVMHVGGVDKALPIEELRYRLFEGDWKKLPDFDTLTAKREGELPGGVLDLAPIQENSRYAVCFTGVLDVKAAGTYTFFLNSDDGSRVLIDGEMVVEYDGVHGAAKERKGVVELTAARHDLRVEFFQGDGGQALHVAYEGPGFERRSLSTTGKAEPRAIPIAVHHHPVVMRVHVQDAASRTIAVGLPGAMNFCFDAQECCVQFGWAGAFLDVAPDRESRGGGPCKILGRRFEVGSVGFPLRTAGGVKRPVRFLGYRTGMAPAFSLDWGGTEVTWTVSAAPTAVGLRYTFAIPDAQQDVQFAIDPGKLELESTAGSWQGGVLTVPAASCREFSITLTVPAGGQK